MININLKFNDDELYVTAIINFEENKYNNCTFKLNNSFVIESIKCNGKETSWIKEREYRPTFQEVCQEIAITEDEIIKELEIVYHGKVNSWCNIIEQNKKALSYYSAWYPSGDYFGYMDAIVYISGLEDHIIIKGEFNEESGIWSYGKPNLDKCNIIALKKGEYDVISNEYLNIYCLNEEEVNCASFIKHSFKDILDYYTTTLYGPRDIEKFDIVSLSLNPEKHSGAYFRNNLIVCAQLIFDKDDITHLFAHELGHKWATGADTNTWEDWLNETFAEWSALLYLEEKNKEQFDLWIERGFSILQGLPPIKSIDGSRPNGVHVKGTMLLYEIYEKYGKEPIIDITRLFYKLPAKNTKNFLAEVKENIGSDIADYIRKGLDK